MGDAVEKEVVELDEEPRDLDVEEDVIEVYEANWETVQVFKASSWVVHILTDGKIIHQDISSAEILATCAMLDYGDVELRKRILIGITYWMVPAAREFLNNRTEKSQTQHRVRPPQELTQ